MTDRQTDRQMDEVHVEITRKGSLTLAQISFSYTRKCTTLWCEPDRVHPQNMEQLHAFDCHQNVAEP